MACGTWGSGLGGVCRRALQSGKCEVGCRGGPCGDRRCLCSRVDTGKIGRRPWQLRTASGNRRHSSRFRLPGLGVVGGMVQPGPHVSWCDRDGALGLPYKGTSAPLTPSSPWPHPSGVPVCWLTEASAAQVSLRRWFWEQWHPDHRPRSDPVLTRCSSLRGPGSAGGRLPALDPKELGQAPPEGGRGPRAASLALGQSLPSWG